MLLPLQSACNLVATEVANAMMAMTDRIREILLVLMGGKAYFPPTVVSTLSGLLYSRKSVEETRLRSWGLATFRRRVPQLLVAELRWWSTLNLAETRVRELNLEVISELF